MKLPSFFRKSQYSSLEKVLDFSSGLPPAQAIERVERGVAEIVYADGQHRACGLLVGKGYFITTKHTFEDGIGNKRLVDYAGREFQVIAPIFVARRFDLALAKIKRPVDEFTEYDFLDLSSIDTFSPSVLLGRRDGKIYSKGCFPVTPNISRTVHSNNIFSNQMEPVIGFSMGSGESGDSGGTFVTAEGKIVGFLKGSWPGEENSYVYSLKISQMRRLIENYLAKH
jgi:hypothetical protein